MKYGSILGLDKKISRIIFGTSAIESQTGLKYKLDSSNKREIFKLLDLAFLNGYNAFDTSPLYMLGESEKILGEWIRINGIRSKVIIITKGGHPSFILGKSDLNCQRIERDIKESLSRLDTDYIDIYMLHRDNLRVPVKYILEILNPYVLSNKIHLIGASNWNSSRIEESNKYAKKYNLKPFVISSPHFSLFEWITPPWKGTLSIAGEKGRIERKWYATNKFPIFAWSPLGNNFISLKSPLSSRVPFFSLKKNSYISSSNVERLHRAQTVADRKDKLLTQILLAYIINQSFYYYPIVRSTKEDNIRQNMKACYIDLTLEELDWLNLSSDKNPYI